MIKQTVIKQMWDVFTQSGRHETILKCVQIVSAGNGKCQAKFTVQRAHTNQLGGLHGGMTASLVDVISTLALMSTEPHLPGVSVDLSVSYMRSAKEGDEVTVNADVLKVGKNLSFLTVDLLNADGKLIAQGKHTKFVGQQDSKV